MSGTPDDPSSSPSTPIQRQLLRTPLGTRPSWHVQVRLEVPELEETYTLTVVMQEEYLPHLTDLRLGHEIGKAVVIHVHM